MKRILAIAVSCLALSGCATVVDIGVVSGGVAFLEPIVNNNPNTKPWRQETRPICYYQISPYTIKADVCPVGIAPGTRL